MPNVPKPRLRLGDGSLNSDDATLWEARSAFLAAVYRVQPATYWSLFPAEPGAHAYESWRARWNDNPRAMVEWWQAEWHLPDPWLADVALNTQRARLRYFINGQTHVMPAVGRGATNERWTHPFVTPRLRSDHAAGRPFWIPPAEQFWNPTKETREAVQTRIAALVKSELDRIEAETSDGRRATITKTPEHFVWLARFQVGDESKTMLSSALGMSRESIGRTINELAAFIGLEPREYVPGRPKRKTARTVKPVRIRR